MKGFVRPILYRLAQRLSARAYESDLFEKSGERVAQEPLQVEPVPEQAGSHKGNKPAEALFSGVQLMTAKEIKRLIDQPQRWLIVNHWATWCDPCLEELPELRSLRESVSDDVLLLGIGWDLFEGGSPPQTLEKVAQFMEDHQLDYPCWVVSDEPDVFFSTLALDWKKIPQTLVIEPNGQVVKNINGLITAEILAELRDVIP